MIYADLHIHIGRSLDGRPVKITASKGQTLPHVLQIATHTKGLSLVGIIDSHSIGVRQDINTLIRDNMLKPLSGGGYKWDNLVVILGTEIEIKVGNGFAHFLAYFPSVYHLENYIQKIKSSVSNWQLGSQRVYLHVEGWIEAVDAAEGIWLPAHVFTPHKGIYGNCCDRLDECLPTFPAAIELGLSADSSMASRIKELDNVAFLSNSDAHSLQNIAREFNIIELNDLSFIGLKDLLLRKAGTVLKNVGIPPAYGKYHRGFCLECQEIINTADPSFQCPRCLTTKIVKGVWDRTVSIADRRPIYNKSYIYQIPLLDLPGIGPKTYNNLIMKFGNEIAILHEVREEDLKKVVGNSIVKFIISMREGQFNIEPGGGGIFGKVTFKNIN